MSEAPLVSVVTATYNMGRYVGAAVESVLAQSHPRMEAVVVDDGSTDDTAAALARFADDPRVKVIRQENAGQTVAKNRGLHEARGEFVGFCDADDLWLPRKVERQLPLFDDAGRVAVVYGRFEVIDAEGRFLRAPRFPAHAGRITEPLLADNFVHFPTALARRDVLLEKGGFDESLTMGIDYDLWLRVSVDHDFAFLDEILVRYRVWEGQMSRRMGERFDNAFRLMTAFLERHPDSVSPAGQRAAWAHTHVSRALWHLEEGRRREAWRDFRSALARRPWDRRLWRGLLGLAGPVRSRT